MIWTRDDLSPVADDDASDDLGQLVFAFSRRQDFEAAITSLNTISLAAIGDRRKRALRPHGPVAHRGEHALDGIGRPKVILMTMTAYIAVLIVVDLALWSVGLCARPRWLNLCSADAPPGARGVMLASFGKADLDVLQG